VALALDASTPSMVKGTTTPATTAAFSPPAGSLLFAICEADELNTFSISNTGTALTWTSIGASTNQSGEGSIQIYWAYAAAAPGSITVSSARTGSFTANALKVLVFTGAETSFTGAKAAAFATTVNVTTTGNNSWVWAGHIEENGGADTAATGCSFNDAETSFGGIGGGVLKRTATTPASGTVVTIGVTSATIPAIVAFEVKEGAGSTTQGGTSTALHPGKGPTQARFYQTPRSTDVTTTALTLSDTATGATAGVPADTAAIGVALADTASGVRAGVPVDSAAVGVVLVDSLGGARAGVPGGEQAVNSIVLTDPGAGGARTGGGADSLAVGVVLADTMGGVRGGAPTETLANGIVLLDVLSGVRASSPSDTLAIGFVLTDTVGGVRAGDPLGETATAALSLADPAAGGARAGSPSGTFTIGVALADTASGVRLGVPIGALSYAVVLADVSGGARAGSKTDSLIFGATTGFVCQDFTTTAVVDAYSGVATVDAYSGTRTVDAYAGSFTVDAYTGSATNCGR